MQNLHTHSTWDDGKASVEAMILAAKAAGLREIGISLHSPLDFVSDWTAKPEDIPAYIDEVRGLARKYAGEIEVYAGIEWDVLSRIDLAPFDYVIGSAHFVPGADHPSVDESPEATARMIARDYGGDADAAAEAYFAELAKVAREPRAQIVGHFDLITKFDEKHHFFDEHSPRYVAAAEAAMDELVAAGKIFEINTGAISRGWRTTPYPSAMWLKRLHEIGGRITITADAHAPEGIACAFDDARRLAKECGFTEIWELHGGVFVPVKL